MCSALLVPFLMLGIQSTCHFRHNMEFEDPSLLILSQGEPITGVVTWPSHTMDSPRMAWSFNKSFVMNHSLQIHLAPAIKFSLWIWKWAVVFSHEVGVLRSWTHPRRSATGLVAECPCGHLLPSGFSRSDFSTDFFTVILPLTLTVAFICSKYFSSLIN